MSQQSVLISGVAGDIGQSVARALSSDFRIFGCDMEDGASSRLCTKNFFCVPPAAQNEEYLKAVGDLICREKIDIFIPVAEAEIALLNLQREWTSGVNANVLLNNQEVVTTFSDKLETAKFLRAHGWKAPRSALLKEMIRQEWSFPVIVKSRSGCGSKRVYKVMDDFELEFFCRRDKGDFIIQEYLDEGDGEFTTGVFSDGKNTVSITFRRKLGFGGLSREAILVKDEGMEKLARDIAAQVKLVGSINIQSRKSGGEHLPFEINPRLSSTVLLRQAFGFEDLRWWIATLEGRNFVYRPRFRKGRAVRVLGEHFMDMEP